MISLWWPLQAWRPSLAPPTPQHQQHYANLSVSAQFIFQFPSGWVPTLFLPSIFPPAHVLFILLSLSKPLWPLLRGRIWVFFPKWASEHSLTSAADGNKKPATIHISSKGIREEWDQILDHGVLCAGDRTKANKWPISVFAIHTNTHGCIYITFTKPAVETL